MALGRRRRLPSDFFNAYDAGGTFDPSYGPRPSEFTSPDPDYSFDPSTPGTGALRDAYSPSAYQAQPSPYRDIFQPRLEAAGERLLSAFDAPHRGGPFRQAIGSFFNPRGLGGVISGDLGRQRNIDSAVSDYGLLNQMAQAQQRSELFPLQRESMLANIEST